MLVSLCLAASLSAAEGIVLHGTKIRSDEIPGDNRVVQRGLTPDRWQPQEPDLARKSSWSLPARALSEGAQVSKRVLVLRFNFRPDSPDDSSRTTGNGRMDLSNPLAHDSTDYDSEYYRRVGHLVDPPPHDSAYFDAHLRALSRYYETVSEGKIELDWDVYPPKKDSVYVLPHPMSYYGKCEFDSVVFGLTRYFVDCIRVADSTSPEILFSNYESVFLFHAGSDRQNDLGFPETCADLFTGFIRYFPQPSEGFDTAWVDNRTSFVQTALIMPEAASQDNRATALNAVLAHEFGHQLGLVDLYATNTFMSQLGDFALMDNNGFGTGIDFDYEVGRVFGAIPLFPEAWSRAYLGYVDVYDYRQGSDVRVVAAEAVSSGIKIARVPVSENEYYLIENRLVDTDRRTTAMLVDSLTYVFQGPVDSATRAFTGEYDFLLPGSGLLIFHVDEGVAGLDYDGDGVSNFDDNDLQWDWDRRFIRLIEADGLINFGGYYRSGYGREEDMFRDDRNQAFTPNTNPRTFDNSGNNTHVHITNIARDTAIVGGLPRLLDTVMLFNVATDGLADGFPVRAGFPRYGLSPIADDIDKDGTPEIIAASGRNLLLFTTNGENFLHKVTACDPCSTYYD
ncbi:MAG TPA: hypothetical protein VN285_11305, partial [Candidatus Deferrimicrobium sp.]|nr:hypothetical protein [Candidatus Deferrimicrobium sp.]